MKWRAKPTLTRQAWLEKLARRLMWTFPVAQVKDILADYQEQFDAGRSHGRTEAEMIQALGTPEEASALLLEEEPSARMDSLRQTVLWGAALSLCCSGLWLGLLRSIIHAASLLFFLFLPLTVSALFLLLRGPARVTLEERFSPERTVSPVGAYYVPATLIVVYEGVEQLLLVLGRAGLLPDHIGPFVMAEINTYFLIAVELVLIALLLWLLVRSLTVSIRYFPGVIHTFGAGSSLFFTYTFFISCHIGTFSSVSIGLLLALLPYCAGLVTALAFQRWVDRRRPLPRFFQDSEVTWEDWRHRLGVGLLGWYDATQAIEVLEDYQEQYDLGLEQGKSEESLLSEMGRPEAVVRDLLKEDRKARLRRRKIWIWAVAAAVSAWLLLGYVSAFEFGAVGVNRMLYYGPDSWMPGVVALPLGTAALFVLFRARERAVMERRFPARRKPSIWLLVPPLVCSALVEGLGMQCIYAAHTRFDPIFLGQSLVWYFITSLEFSVLFLALLLIWTLARCVSGAIFHLPAVPFLAGSFAQVVCVGLYLSAMDLESLYLESTGTVRAFLANLRPLGLGVLLALAVWLVIRAAGKPRKEG